MKSISKPDLLNGTKQFRFSLKNNFINLKNPFKVEIENKKFNSAFYLNLLGITFIVFSIIILYYRYSKKGNKKDQIMKFLKEVKDHTNNNKSPNNNK